MSDAGLAFVKLGQTAEAGRIWERIEGSGAADELFQMLEHAAPGTVKKKPRPASGPENP